MSPHPGPRSDATTATPRRAPVLSILALALFPLSLIVSALVMLAVPTPTVTGNAGSQLSSISRAGVFTMLGCIGLSLVLALIAILRNERPRTLCVTVVVLVIVLVALFAGNQYQDPQFGQGTDAPR